MTSNNRPQLRVASQLRFRLHILGLLAWIAAVPIVAPLAHASAAQATWNVEVEALGQKNPKSQGTELWVYEIRTPTEVLQWQNAEQSGPKWDFVPRAAATGGLAALATGNTHRSLR